MSVNEKMTDLANSIRAKTGGTEKLSLEQMAGGVDEVYSIGRLQGYNEGYDIGYDTGHSTGEKRGYNEGREAGQEEGQNDIIIRFTNNYTRGNYESAFQYTDFSHFVFDKPINVSNTTYMFHYYAGEYIPIGLDATNASVSTISAQFMCRYARKLKVFSDIKLPIQTRYAGTWQFCDELETIELVRCDENTDFSAFVHDAKKLKNISFEGIIGQDIQFETNSVLSKASIINVFEHLSNSASGKTVTFTSSAVTNAFGSTDAAEWTNLVASKPNWTITLV